MQAKEFLREAGVDVRSSLRTVGDLVEGADLEWITALAVNSFDELADPADDLRVLTAMREGRGSLPNGYMFAPVQHAVGVATEAIRSGDVTPRMRRVRLFCCFHIVWFEGMHHPDGLYPDDTHALCLLDDALVIGGSVIDAAAAVFAWRLAEERCDRIEVARVAVLCTALLACSGGRHDMEAGLGHLSTWALDEVGHLLAVHRNRGEPGSKGGELVANELHNLATLHLALRECTAERVASDTEGDILSSLERGLGAALASIEEE
jgi:hypothetical protein